MGLPLTIWESGPTNLAPEEKFTGGLAVPFLVWLGPSSSAKDSRVDQAVVVG